jgi:YD repeat-containing protein
LKSAVYSDGRSFNYTYDVNGNTLEASDSTTATTYTYDAANQLVTAQSEDTAWNYVYDGNGSLVKVLPNGSESNGAKRYTYNAAGYLVKVEAHDENSWNIQAEMNYDGMGARLTTSANGITSYYALDGQMPLTVSTDGKVITILYGREPIAEKTDEWNYVLSDSTGTPRQLTNIDSHVTLSIRYSPWGKPIDTEGIENFDASYVSSLVDFTTGLMYIGNGQYYDPETGRFLTRGANPNSPNPYVPFNPLGLLLAPLALAAVVSPRKKIKGKKIKGKKIKGAVTVGFLSLFLAACVRVTIIIIGLLIIGALILVGCTVRNPTQPPTNGNGASINQSETVAPNTPVAPNGTTEPPATKDPCANGQCTATPTPAPTETPYHADEAVRYTRQYYSVYNGDYLVFSGIGGDCTNFISQSLYAGGLRETRTEIGSSGIAYWDRNKVLTGTSYSSSEVGTWSHAVVFWDYLTSTRGLNTGFTYCPQQCACNGVTQIPHIYDGNINDPNKQNADWATYLQSNAQEGDIVFYKFANSGPGRWDHVAIVTERQMFQTLYGEGNNITTPTPEPSTYPFKPRVLEHSGSITTDVYGRSIDNTKLVISQIAIIRIPPNINQMSTR